LRVTYLGHSSVLLELDGVRLLTDPLLRDRVLHLVRHADPVGLDSVRAVDAVLVSHLHHDHYDPASLRLLDRGARLIVPEGAKAMAERLGFEQTTELAVGESVDIGALRVQATPAEHRRGRLLARGPRPIGFRVTGTSSSYFAGDTDLFSDMEEIRGDGLDLALLPVWGWGPRLPAGHLDPVTAARAAALLAPRVAIPIHWGTFALRGLKLARPRFLIDPPFQFESAVAETGAPVEVRVLQPGQSAEV
jgi:L-ascorbate metabolism protein UlaG (beta-lactamase superfamily)